MASSSSISVFVGFPYMILTICTVFQCISSTLAWGREGHAIIANIAYERLSNSTKEKVSTILFPNGYNRTEYGEATPMGAVASWADNARYSKFYSWTGPLHYVDVQDQNIPGGCPSTSTSVVVVGRGGGSLRQRTGDQKRRGGGRILDDDESNVTTTTTTMAHNNDDDKECVFEYDRDCKDDFCAVGGIVDFSNNLLRRTRRYSPETIRYSNPSLFLDNERSRNTVKTTSTTTSSTTTKTTRFLRGSNSDLTEPITNDSTTTDTPPQPIIVHHPAISDIGTFDSLKFFIHIVGDVHQPLHVSRTSDIGGNEIHVKFSEDVERPYRDGRTGALHSGWNLHSVWDTGLIQKAMKKYYNNSQDAFQTNIEHLLRNQTTVDHWLSCAHGQKRECTSTWAKETFQDALSWAYGDENGNEVVDGSKISELYFETRLVVVERKLAEGGVRLAASLEAIFGE